MEKAKVYIRNVNHKDKKRWTVLEKDALQIAAQPTLKDLKKVVVEELQQSWSEFAPTENIPLTKENIRVFRKEIDTSEEDKDTSEPKLQSLSSDPSGEGEVLRADCAYYALEYFEIAPMDMLRTVKHNQTRPAVPCHPDNHRHWTEVAPVYCAGMKHSELDFPWLSVCSETNNLIAHGTSLRCKDEAEAISDLEIDGVDFDPFGPITADEKRGSRSLTLNQYKGIVERQGAELDPYLGILKTTVSHRAKSILSVPKPEPEAKKRKGQKKAVAKRIVCFRYVLKKGTDLAPHGMALVYDNSSEYHWSLIRLKETTMGREWAPFKRNELFLPGESYRQFLENTGEARDEIVRNEILRFFVDMPEPEISVAMIQNQEFGVFPKVAALFAFHDVTMQASAEPEPLEKFDDTSQKTMYWAALVLFRFGYDDDVRMALEDLEAAEYRVEDLDTPCCQTLLQALKEALNDEDISEVELEASAMDADEALHDGAQVLEKYIQGTPSVKTPKAAKGAPGKGSPESTSTQSGKGSPESTSM